MSKIASRPVPSPYCTLCILQHILPYQNNEHIQASANIDFHKECKRKISVNPAPSYIKVDICSQKDWTGNANITIIGSYKYLEQTCVKHKCCGEIEQKLFFWRSFASISRL